MRIILLASAALLLLTAPARAADLTFSVRGDDGAPLADAVLIVKPSGAAAPTTPIRFNWSMTMAQQNIAFSPYVLIVPVGSDVGFPNHDKVRHHVYSFSATKRFELKLYGQQEERTVRFDKAGIVPLGCNIHDQMIGYIVVVDSPFAAKTNAAGEAVIRGLPNGRASLSVWHPDMRARLPIEKPLAISGAGRDVEVIPLRPPAARVRH